MNGKYPGVPRFSTPIVDVRDVALAHLRAITVKEAANQRFILVNENLWFKQVADILLAEFEPLGWSFSTW
jgi:nucleoside-diphosphate-sugar epimerase